MPNSAITAIPARPGTSPTEPTGSVEGSMRDPIRYQVRVVMWGARRRYEIRDTVAGTTLAIRSTQEIADGDVLVLNMRGRTQRRSPPVSPPVPPEGNRLEPGQSE